MADIVGTDRGAVYVYRFNGTTWNYQATLSPVDLGNCDQFGLKVDIDGDYCAVGAPYQDFTGCIFIGCQTFYDVGAAYIFFYTGGIWGQQTKLPRAFGETLAYH